MYCSSMYGCPELFHRQLLALTQDWLELQQKHD